MTTKDLEHLTNWLDQCIQQERVLRYRCEVTNLGLDVRLEARRQEPHEDTRVRRYFFGWPALHAGSWELMEQTLEKLVDELA